MEIINRLSDPIYTYVLVASIAIPVAGLISLFREKKNILEKLLSAIEFREKFIEYCNSGGNNSEAYNWMILNSNKVQMEMGPYGVYDTFRPPYANYTIRNYPILLNMLPDLRRYIEDDRRSLGSFFQDMIHNQINVIDEALLRYIGVLQEAEKKAVRRVKNPLLWWKQGIEKILTAPLSVMSTFELIGRSAIGSIERSFIFKIFVAAAAVLSFVANFVTITQGADVTKAWANQFITWLAQFFV